MLKIYTFCDKRPDFIKLQHDSFKKFIKEDYEYIVFDNSSSNYLSKQIKSLCMDLNIKCFDCEKNHNDPVKACYTPINFFIKNHLNESDISVIIDSDIFMINHFNFEEYISNYDLCGIYQQRQDGNIVYIWNAFVIINSEKIQEKGITLNFEPIKGTDVGGRTNEVIDKLNIKWVKHTADIEDDESEIFKDIINYDSRFGCQLIDRSFIHYYRGSNWDRMDEKYHMNKTNFIKDLLNLSPINFNDQTLNKYLTEKSHSEKHWNGIRYNKKNK